MTPEQRAILNKLLTGHDDRLPMGDYAAKAEVESTASPPKKEYAEWHQRRIRHGIILRVCRISSFLYVDICRLDKSTLLLVPAPRVTHLKELYSEFHETVTEDMAQLLTSEDISVARPHRRILTYMVLHYSIR